ncbi:S-adenosyl-L-methionine-dependent methyltransferase [Apiosordaria backusii]|uniref:S-adenosyl-L-methionine-dependent methyltransferase n=1 Tax=Apiosordaria backusii TaxID=314023 RepID=A0AA40DM37_9PEZI|nr:S-adenosyl-L-methionine-dependent methyltransferase [Apiosordaria backusii]
MSSKYVHGHSAAVLAAHARRTAARDAAYLIPHIKSHFRILDIGCGPGTISADLAALVPQGRVTCLEIADSALDAARNTFSSHSITNVDFVVGDVTSRLPFGDNNFDVVHLHMVVMHLPCSPTVALKEVRRVLKNGGVVGCKEMIMDTTRWFPVDKRLDVWEKGITGTIAETGGSPNMGMALKKAALEAGFEEDKVKSAASSWCFSDGEAVQFFSNSCAKRFREGSELRERTVRGGYATEDEVNDFVKACYEWKEKKGAWFGVMNGELLAWK